RATAGRQHCGDRKQGWPPAWAALTWPPTHIVRMYIIDFGASHATPITEYASRGASALPLADGAGEAHVYALHFSAGGEIGPHPAGFGQLFLVVRGDAWVAGGDGVRRA